ncbi:MAG TPA: MBL fold metallo-hydrolase [Burkholderiales bacterium]|nr:MBL fold metallo-hydrolase [Burkholderiales bacterium]
MLSPWKAPRAQGAGKRTRLILLGTGGGPRIVAPGRSKPASLLIINGVPYVIDCGEGVAHQVVLAGVPLNTLRHVFITHHHSDHDLDYGNLIYDGWAAGLRTPVTAYGPPPIKAMTAAYWELNKFDIETRIADEGRPDLRKLVAVREFDQPGLVMHNEDVRVSAAQVRHPPIKQAYAYRFDAADRSIVLSGDTTFSPELIELSRGADVLVHEVMHLGGLENLLKRVPNAATLREHLLASHTVTEDVGKVAAAAGVKTVVLTHLVPSDDSSITDEMWTEGVRKHFGGQVIVGRDLLEI